MLNKTDIQLLRLLEQDGRISYSALGEKVGLSKTPCWNRVKQLQEKGVIKGYRTQLDPQALSLHIRALVHVVVDFERYQAFEEAIVLHSAIRECHAVTGDFDYVLEIFAADIQAFDTLLRAELSKLPGVQRFTTSISTRMVKEQGPYTAML